MSKPRSASLQVAHKRECVHATKTSLGSLIGCTCKPSYYTVHRHGGARVKGPRLRNRQLADRALRKLEVALDEDRAEVGPNRRKKRTFDEWADEYLTNERDGNKGSTGRAYKATLRYASPIIGGLYLDDIGQPELRVIVREIRKRQNAGSDATVKKHLRHLHAIFAAAVEDDVAARNPVSRKFVKGLRLRVPEGVEPYTTIELGKLWAQMDALNYKPVYVFVAKASVVTGARLGELIASDWDHLDLTNRKLHLRLHYDRVDGMTLPKDSEERTVNLIPSAVALFERWTALSGVQPGNSPIFPSPRGQRLNGQYVSRLVDRARVEAGIPDLGEGGRKRRPFHGLRASYARLGREQGLDPQWVQAQLGHSDPALTLNVYGRWSDAASTAEADRAADFPIAIDGEER